MKEKKYLYGMTRRDFIKATSVVGGAAVLGINPLDALIAEASVEPMSSETMAEQEKLYEAAKKEGKVTLYQSSSTQAGSTLITAFNKKYPGYRMAGRKNHL